MHPHPRREKIALTGLLVYLTRLPFAECPQMDMVKNLLKLFPHGDTCGKAAGISMEDELSGALTLAFSMLTVGADGLEGVFDSRCPICATEESVLGVVKQAMADQGLTLENDSMIPPHHVDGNSTFRKGRCCPYTRTTQALRAAARLQEGAPMSIL